MRAAGAVAWAMVAVASPFTSFAQSVDLEFSRDAALDRCPDEATFRDALSRHVAVARSASEPRAGPHEVNRIVVRYRAGEAPSAVRIEVRTLAGEAVRGVFQRSTTRAGCAATAGELALQLGFLLQPVGDARDAGPGADALDAATVALDGAVTDATAGRAVVGGAAVDVPPDASRGPLNLQLFAGGGATVLGTPEVEPDLHVGIGLSGRLWSVRGQAILGFPTEVAGALPPRSSRRWLGDLVACWMPLWIGLCGGVQAGVLEVEHRAGAAVGRDTLGLFSVLFRGLFDREIVRRLRVWAAIDLTVQVVVPEVVSSEPGGGAGRWASDGVGVSASAGLATELF